MEFLNQYSTQIIIALIGLVATGTLIFRIINKSNKVTQKNNTVKGDLAGRDINK